MARKQKTKKRKSPAKKPRASSLSLGFAFLTLFILGVVGVAALYIYIDRQVERRLVSRTFDQLPAVYSEPLAINSGKKLSADFVKSAFLDRRYREVASNPLNPGEFRMNGSTVDFVTREFRGSDGSIRPVSHVQYDFEQGALSSKGAARIDAAYLEPSVISYLGNGELRASNQKSLKDFPDNLKKALISIEDERFYSHHGIDLMGIARAMFRNIKAMRIVEGGSTLTQQLAKNVLFSPKKTIGRKVMEMLAAVSLERRLPKDQILELYMNEVYMGQEGVVALHGFAEAASTFFGKKIEDINLSEAALLAGMVKAPSAYSPRKHLKKVLKRRDTVLDKMLERGVITEAQAKQAKEFKVQIIGRNLHERNAPHFVTALTKDLADVVDIGSSTFSGVSVYTSLDPNLQHCAEQAVATHLEQLEKAHPGWKKKEAPIEGALVAIEPFSGKIKAWVGSRQYSKNQFDHVNLAKRQIGSTIKPFLYLTALDGNLNHYKVATPLTILTDEPLKVNLVTKNSWTPKNYDRKFRGDVTLRYALENSLNIPAAYVGQKVGIDALVRTAKRFHLGDNIQAVPALALGAMDTTLLDLTAGYAALANGGMYVAPRLYLSVLDSTGETLARSKLIEENAADENAVYVLTNILQGVIERGTAKAVRSLGFTAEAAGKTGTSEETRDAWFVGFTPDLAAGVWVGFDDNSPTGVTGGVASAPVWTDFMKCAAPYHEEKSFLPPSGVVFKKIDMESGELATPECPSSSTVPEVFVKGTEPVDYCRLHSSGGRAYAPEAEASNDENRPPPKRRKGLWDMLFGE